MDAASVRAGDIRVRDRARPAGSRAQFLLHGHEHPDRGLAGGIPALDTLPASMQEAREARSCPPATRASGIDPRRIQVAPDDPGLRGDRSAASQCRHPRIGRAGEARADDLRVGLEQRPIAARVPDNPARADFDRPSAEDRHGERVSIGDLPVRGTRTGAHVADRVPALGDDQPSSCAVERARSRPSAAGRAGGSAVRTNRQTQRHAQA